MFIKIDTRENDLMATMALLFKEHNHTINMEKMALGDIILIDKKNDEIEKEKIIFERKSLYDLASSIKDGRYNEQSFRLNNHIIHNHNIFSGCFLMLQMTQLYCFFRMFAPKPPKMQR